LIKAIKVVKQKLMHVSLVKMNRQLLSEKNKSSRMRKMRMKRTAFVRDWDKLFIRWEDEEIESIYVNGRETSSAWWLEEGLFLF